MLHLCFSFRKGLNMPSSFAKAIHLHAFLLPSLVFLTYNLLTVSLLPLLLHILVATQLILCSSATLVTLPVLSFEDKKMLKQHRRQWLHDPTIWLLTDFSFKIAQSKPKVWVDLCEFPNAPCISQVTQTTSLF